MEIIKTFKTIDGKLFENEWEALKHEQSAELTRLRLIDSLGEVFIEFWESTDRDMSVNQDARKLCKDYTITTGDTIMAPQPFYKKLRELCRINDWKYITSGVGVLRKVSFVGYKRLRRPNTPLTSDE